MSASFDPGPTVEALIDLLQAGMPAKLTALDTEYGDFSLGSINKWYRARLGQYDVYPCQVVAPVGPGFVENQEEAFAVRHHGIEVVTYDVSSIETATVGGDALLPPEVMQVRMGRYARATAEILDAGRSLTVANVYEGAEILEIEPPDWQDFEFNTGDPAIQRRSFITPLVVIVK